MKQWSYYDALTGMFSRKKNSTPDAERPVPPEGFSLIEGDYDPLCQRVDLSTGEVVEYQPSRPSDDHEWHDKSRRWELKQEVAAANLRAAEAQGRLREIEARQHRRVRELLAANDPIMKGYEEEAASLRQQLQPSREATSKVRGGDE